jgi:cytochrome c oxidase subunit 2
MQMLIVGVIASAILIAGLLSLHWFPANRSTQAGPIDTMYDVLLIVSVPFFVLVCVVVGFSARKFRHKPGDELKDGPPIHGNTRLEIIWTAVPAVTLIALCIYAYVVLTDIEKGSKDEMVVNVTGQQFAWRFDYPQAGKKVVSDELYVPVGRKIIFKEHALDVLHSFWVPQFRMKNDAVPGITTTTRVTPTKVGDFPIVCAELCGLGHAEMRSTVHVVEPAVFTAWLQKQSGGANATAGGARPQTGSSGGSNGGGGAAGGAAQASQGRAIFTGQGGCTACHALGDAKSTATTGPPLDVTLKGKPPAYIMQSIIAPNAVLAKGYRPDIMPQTFGKTLSKDQIASLVAYLAKVTK